MKSLLTANEVKNFKTDGAIVLRKKFDISWIEKLKIGIKKDIKSPSPRFKSHTIQKNIPAYLDKQQYTKKEIETPPGFQ